MALGTLSPSAKQYFFDIVTGEPLAGGYVYTVSAGGVSPGNAIATFQNDALTIQNSNPIHLNGAGYCTIYLTPGQSYKYIVTDANGVTVWTQDGIGSVPTSASSIDIIVTAGENIASEASVYISDGSGGKTQGLAYNASATNAYSSSQAGIVGLALAMINSGSQGSVRIGGQDTLAQTLTIGKQYIGTVAGSIVTTAPANVRFLGSADTVNSIVLDPSLSTTPATSTITTTGTQIALAIPTGTADLVIFANNATLLTLQGIAAGLDGQRLTIFSIGAGQVDLANQNGSAAAANRLINQITGTISLAAGAGRVDLIYDTTTARWRVRAHDQGAWIDYASTSTVVGWSAFTTEIISYYVVGRLVLVDFQIEGTSNATNATFTLPFAKSSAGPSTSYIAVNLVVDNGTQEAAGYCTLNASSSTVTSLRSAGTAWTNVNGKRVAGQFWYQPA